jgi:hypothetical protein
MKTKSILDTLTMCAALLLSVGCYKPFDKPEYENVDTAETAFLIPLEGDTSNQAQFQSATYLESHKVAAKRVQITHRWNQTGRWGDDGEWIPNVRLIKVNRSPVTREWTASTANGTAAKDQAIWVESQDSVGFSMGFTVTGYIKEEDAATFLYWYPTGSLEKVMDTEARARVQQNVSEVAAKYALDILRSKKQEMTDAARADVVKFFSTRGITITTVASFGGMTYENPKIQAAIDEVFVAQQTKDVNQAKLEAQQKANDRIELEANGTAEKMRREAQGLADSKTIAAKADADALVLLSKAIRDAGPSVVQLRTLDIERERVAKWDGKYPLYMLGSGSSAPTMMLSMPTPPLEK